MTIPLGECSPAGFNSARSPKHSCASVPRACNRVPGAPTPWPTPASTIPHRSRNVSACCSARSNSILARGRAPGEAEHLGEVARLETRVEREGHRVQPDDLALDAERRDVGGARRARAEEQLVRRRPAPAPVLAKVARRPLAVALERARRAHLAAALAVTSSARQQQREQRSARGRRPNARHGFARPRPLTSQ